MRTPTDASDSAAACTAPRSQSAPLWDVFRTVTRRSGVATMPISACVAVVARRGRDHRYEGAEHVTAMTLENRARHARAVTGCQKRLDDLGVDGNRECREELVAGGIDEIGPAHAHSARA